MWDKKWEVCRAKASKPWMKKKHYEKVWRSLLKHKTQHSCSDLFTLLQITFAIQPQMLVLIVREKKQNKNKHYQFKIWKYKKITSLTILIPPHILLKLWIKRLKTLDENVCIFFNTALIFILWENVHYSSKLRSITQKLILDVKYCFNRKLKADLHGAR